MRQIGDKQTPSCSRFVGKRTILCCGGLEQMFWVCSPSVSGADEVKIGGFVCSDCLFDWTYWFQ